MTIAQHGFGGMRLDRPRLRQAAAILGNALGWPARAWRARQLLEQLGAFDDRALRDIGLLRQDLRDAVALRPGQDPSFMLQHRVRSRRRR